MPTSRTIVGVFDFIIQIILSTILFYVLTSFAFIMGWETHLFLSLHGKFHFWLGISLIIVAAILCYWRYRFDRRSFFELEPIRLLKIVLSVRPVYSVGILSLIYFMTQFLTLLLMHEGLGTALWDTGFYDQVIWNTGHGNFLVTSVRGGIHVFAEHFKPIMVLLAPLYWIWDSTNFLFLISTVITATSIIWGYLIAKEITKDHVLSLIVAIGIFFYQPMRNGILFPYHTSTLADPFILCGFFLILKRQNVSGCLLLIAAIMCKENIVMEIYGIGFYLASKRNKTGYVVIAITVLMSLLIFGYFEPKYRCAYHVLNKWAYYEHLKNPFKLELWQDLLKPNPLLFLIQVFGPFLFLSFNFKGWHWLLGPTMIVRLLSRMTGFRIITAAYTSGLNSLVILSAILGLTHLSSQKKFAGKDIPTQWMKFVPATLIFGALIFSGTPQLFNIETQFWEASFGQNQRIARILESIPPSYSILSTEVYSAHLSHRPHLYAFYAAFLYTPLFPDSERPDLIVVDEIRINQRERQLVSDYLTKGYSLIFAMNPLKIYKQPNVSIQDTLLNKWEFFRNQPEVPYRKYVRMWYKGIMSILGIVFLVYFILKLIVRKNNFKGPC